MRIVGGKDYYDHGLAYGVDQSLVFVRTGALVPESQWHSAGVALPVGHAPRVRPSQRNGAQMVKQNWSPGYYTSWSHGGCLYRMEDVHALVCGRYYSGARVHSRSASQHDHGYGAAWGKPPAKNGGNWRHRGWRSETFWDSNSLSRYLARCGMAIDSLTRRDFFWREKRDPRHKPFARFRLQGEELAAIITMGVTVATLTADDVERVRDLRYHSSSHNSHRDEHHWRVNDDTLKDVDFVKVMDPVRAFQEISMWIGGVLPRPGPPMVQITDPEVRLAKRGFDRWSFRKEKKGREKT